MQTCQETTQTHEPVHLPLRGQKTTVGGAWIEKFMNIEAIDYYGRKFFPHLTPQYQRLCILAVHESISKNQSVDANKMVKQSPRQPADLKGKM